MKIAPALVLGMIFFGACQSAPIAIPRQLQVHGHRGSRGTHPENTLPAFQEGFSSGADVLELDLHLSSDDVLIISHDPDINPRLCKIKTPVLIRKLTAAQIAKYDCGSTAQKDFPEQKLIPGTPKPTFEALLTWVEKSTPSSLQLNVETKMDSPNPSLMPDPKAFSAKIIEALKRHHLLERSILQSFDPRTLVAAKKIEPKLRLSWLTESAKFCEEAQHIGAEIASPNYHVVDKANVQDCHARGIAVMPWTVNEPQDWDALVQADVDGIITDYPRKLVRYFAAQKTL